MTPSAFAPCPDNESLKTLEGALKWFSVPSNAIGCIVLKRWPDGVVRCPVCGGKEIRYLASREVWECRTQHPKSQFSVRAGTIFEHSHISLGLWLTAIWMLANRVRPSSHEVARRLGITQKSAWSMLRRIECAWKKAEEKRFSQFELSVRDRRPGSLRWE
jgi:hypothetical protein